MAKWCASVFLAVALLLCIHATSSHPVVTVTGATGHTGSLVYLTLKQQNVTVRALVRNVTKAREYLGCNKCDETEGVYVGDVTKPETLVPAMAGATTVVITTGPAYHCLVPSIYVGCKYYPGADPETMSWEAVKNQVAAFANNTGGEERHVVLVSNDLTTTPDNFLDKIDNGHGCFYALNGEAFTMSSGMPFTIVKPNGLGEGNPAQKEIVVAHDDQGWSPLDLNYEFIARSDVARLLAYAAMHPEDTVGLRFDVTSKKEGGAPTKDVSAVFRDAMYEWDPRRAY